MQILVVLCASWDIKIANEVHTELPYFLRRPSCCSHDMCVLMYCVHV